MNQQSTASYIPPREFAARLSMHTETVRRMIREGRLRAVRVGGRLRVRADELDRLVSENPVVPRRAA